jgi:hypothetical protein
MELLVIKINKKTASIIGLPARGDVLSRRDPLWGHQHQVQNGRYRQTDRELMPKNF